MFHADATSVVLISSSMETALPFLLSLISVPNHGGDYAVTMISPVPWTGNQPIHRSVNQPNILMRRHSKLDVDVGDRHPDQFGAILPLSVQKGTLNVGAVNGPLFEASMPHHASDLRSIASARIC